VPRNVVALVRPPPKVHVDVIALTVEEARALLAAAGNRFEALLILALKTGMRRGELLALRWEDADLDKGVLQVRGTLRRTQEGLSIGTPKTPASRRKVVLSPASVTALLRHRARQEQERQTAGDLWHDLGLAFPNRLGRLMEPATSSPMCTVPFSGALGCRPLPSTLFATPPRRCCWRRVSIPRWSKSYSGTHGSASRWTATAI
jgi:integrase